MNSASAKTLRSQSLSGSYSVEHEFSKCSISRRESACAVQRTAPNLPLPNSVPNGSHLHGKPFNFGGELPNQKFVNTKETKPAGMEKDSPTEQPDKVKNKLMSMWHNIKYGWNVKLKSSFSRDSPIWFLGECYHRQNDDQLYSRSRKNSSGANGIAMGIEGFKLDFVSRIWLTYRREFPVLPGTTLTSDCGWGCMLRSGQMMIAQAFVFHFLGREWRWADNHAWQELMHRQILAWFQDQPGTPFSLHSMVEVGEGISDKKAGEWYGPASVAHILKRVTERAVTHYPELEGVKVYVAQDCTIYIRDVMELCGSTSPDLKSKRKQQTQGQTQARHQSQNPVRRLSVDRQQPSSSNSSDVSDTFSLYTLKASSTSSNPSSPESEAPVVRWRSSVVLLIPVRLGGDSLNPAYGEYIKTLLANDKCLGIIGGKPRHSLYFVGCQDDKLIYLDPHYCQDAVDVRRDHFSVETYHCTTPGKMSISKMDPSCTIGFYCKTYEDFVQFVETATEFSCPYYPVFEISEGSSRDNVVVDGRPANGHRNGSAAGVRGESRLRIRHQFLNPDGTVQSVVDSEEFIML